MGVGVWRSPGIAGSVQRNSLYFVDVEGDGDREIGFARAMGCITRTELAER